MWGLLLPSPHKCGREVSHTCVNISTLLPHTFTLLAPHLEGAPSGRGGAIPARHRCGRALPPHTPMMCEHAPHCCPHFSHTMWGHAQAPALEALPLRLRPCTSPLPPRPAILYRHMECILPVLAVPPPPCRPRRPAAPAAPPPPPALPPC